MATAGKTIKCKAAVAWQPKKPLVIEEVEVEPPGTDQIRVKIVATGLCRTDLFYLNENTNPDHFPIILGHEAAGIVESVGPGVTEFQEGDKVIPLFSAQCQECFLCKSPKTNQCVNAGKVVPHYSKLAPPSKIFCKGKRLLQFVGISTFSEYTVVLREGLAKIDPSAPLDKVFVIGCAFSTGYGAAIKTAKVEAGSSCAVFGMGAVGLAAVAGCKAAGAKRIIAVDNNPGKFKKAEEFGATDFVNPNDHQKPVDEVVCEMTNGGVDYSLECVGNVKLMNTALLSTAKFWGVSVIVGWTDLEETFVKPGDLIAGRTWKGSLFGGYKGKKDVGELVKAYMDKKVKLDEYITHTMPLDRINDAIALLEQGKSIRTLLYFPSQ